MLFEIIITFDVKIIDEIISRRRYNYLGEVKMGVIKINTAIFPKVIGINIGENENKQSIDLPVGVNLLYLQRLSDSVEKALLKKYSNGDTFTDNEYEMLFKLFLTNTPRTTSLNGGISDFINQFGVVIETNDGKITFSLAEDYVQQIKAETWEYIALDLLRQDYEDIIKCFDFGDIHIYLGAWKSESDDIKQTLLNALRAAFMFTIIGYIYGDDRELYQNFKDYFEAEFYKRVALVYGIWKTQEDKLKVDYIPIYDSFYNLKNRSKDDLINTVQAILNSDDIVEDERMMLKNRLINGAEMFHADLDETSKNIENTLIKPIVNYIIEIQSADDVLQAAKTLHNQSLFNSSINRSYYAMMHALKALLENKGLLSDWNPDPNILNVTENHATLERKLKDVVNNCTIDNSYIIDFKYVKQKRWAADYNLIQFSLLESAECLKRAELFVTEIKKITK